VSFPSPTRDIIQQFPTSIPRERFTDIQHITDAFTQSSNHITETWVVTERVGKILHSACAWKGLLEIVSLMLFFNLFKQSRSGHAGLVSLSGGTV
jgi:hypothetical protein